MTKEVAQCIVRYGTALSSAMTFNFSATPSALNVGRSSGPESSFQVAGLNSTAEFAARRTFERIRGWIFIRNDSKAAALMFAQQYPAVLQKGKILKERVNALMTKIVKSMPLYTSYDPSNEAKW